MTTTMPPHGPGSRRAVPPWPTTQQRSALRRWLDNEGMWVLRPSWNQWLASGDDRLMCPVASLTRNQHAAALAWLRQQRHALYRAIEGGDRAPDGWLEERPLYRSLQRLLATD